MSKTLRLLIAMNLALAVAFSGAIALLMAQSANAASGVKLAYTKIETYTPNLRCPSGSFPDQDRKDIEYLVPRDTFPIGATYPVVTGVSATSRYVSGLGGEVITAVSPRSTTWGVMKLRPCRTFAVVGVTLK